MLMTQQQCSTTLSGCNEAPQKSWVDQGAAPLVKIDLACRLLEGGEAALQGNCPAQCVAGYSTMAIGA